MRRLRGPFSPHALRAQLDIERDADRLGAREHAFLVAELVLCLRRVTWRVVGEELHAGWCRQQVEQLLDELASDVGVDDAAIADYLARARRAA